MRLSTRSTYGVRMMALLASGYGGGPILLKAVAERENISEKYLSQIVIPLRSAGLLRSVRGAHGGYTLGREPNKITVREIVEVLEGGLDLVDPRSEESASVQPTDRVIWRVWKRAAAEIGSVFEGVTLAEIVAQGRAESSAQDMYEI